MNKFPIKIPQNKQDQVDQLKTLDTNNYDLDPMTKKLFEKFGWIVFMRSVIPCSDGERILKKYLDKVKPKTALVIGTNRGVSAAFIAQHVDKVITIDIKDNKTKKQVWGHLGLKNITDVIVADNDEKATYLEDVEFDFAFIDADKDDYKIDLKLTEKCGAVLIHEHPDTKIPKSIKGERDNDFIFWCDEPHTTQKDDSSPIAGQKLTKGTKGPKKKPGRKKGAKKAAKKRVTIKKDAPPQNETQGESADVDDIVDDVIDDIDTTFPE